MSRHSLAREFNRSDISKVLPVNGEVPENETYQRLMAGGFADWRLRVDGLIARPVSLSLADLKRLPARPGPVALRALATQWQPWRALAARLLWHHWRHVTGRPTMDDVPTG